MFLYFLKFQQKLINKRLKKIANSSSLKIANPLQIKDAIGDAYRASAIFNMQTRTLNNLILSYIPFTKPFSARVETARRISVLSKKLDTIKFIASRPILRPKNPYRMHVKSKTPPFEQPVIHKSPIGLQPNVSKSPFITFKFPASKCPLVNRL